MYFNEKLLIAKNDENEFYMYPKMMNRHGIITGASGSGKTITLKVIAESLSNARVPSFVVDVKGDLTSLTKAGDMNDNIKSRVEKLNLKDFEAKSFPVTFFDVYGSLGHPIKTSVENMGSKLLSQILNLSQVQESILALIFKIAKDNDMKIITLDDLNELISFVAERKDEFTKDYGNMNSQSINSIKRNILSLKEEIGDNFFKEPLFNIKDFIHYDSNNGYGFINVLNATELFKHPTLYAIFLIWLLNEVYDNFEEVGDLAKPKLVLFFDEAHLLFNDMPNFLVKQIIQIVKLIRSKGVGIFFISQSPSDIPDEILSQLGNKVQHTLRAYTPKEEEKVKVAANSFRKNPKFDTREAIKELKTGEALISFLNENGEPMIVERAFILPPQSLIGALEEDEIKQIVKSSYLYNKYEKEEENANLKDKIKILELEEEKAILEEKNKLEKEKLEKEKLKSKTTTTKKKKSGVEKYADKLANRTISTIGNKLGNKIFKGLFK